MKVSLGDLLVLAACIAGFAWVEWGDHPKPACEPNPAEPQAKQPELTHRKVADYGYATPKTFDPLWIECKDEPKVPGYGSCWSYHKSCVLLVRLPDFGTAKHAVSVYNLRRLQADKVKVEVLAVAGNWFLTDAEIEEEQWRYPDPDETDGQRVERYRRRMLRLQWERGLVPPFSPR